MTPLVAGVPTVGRSDLLAGCVRALLEGDVRPLRIFVIDNADRPLSRPMGWPVDLVRVVRPESNLGCAGAWNLAIALASGRPALLVNDDCAVARDTVARLSRPEPDVLMCAHGFSCFRIDPGVVRRVGTFDEAYFPVYYEDTDYRRRCALAGVTIDEWPLEAVELVGGRDAVGSTGITHGKSEARYQGWSAERDRWLHERIAANRARYVAKWGGPPDAETFSEPFGGKPESASSMPRAMLPRDACP